MDGNNNTNIAINAQDIRRAVEEEEEDNILLIFAVFCPFNPLLSPTCAYLLTALRTS